MNHSRGSPPHTWGILLDLLLVFMCCTVHPHIHGEYSGRLHGTSRSAGSPPHTWGILPHGLLLLMVSRFTPTYMGNTRCCRLAAITVTVHPHIHGEYIIFTTGQTMKTVHPHIHGEYLLLCLDFNDHRGSPPHTWGIRLHRRLHVSDRRFTPTYMGNTSLPAIILAESPGSPPHTWGIRRVRDKV